MTSTTHIHANHFDMLLIILKYHNDIDVHKPNGNICFSKIKFMNKIEYRQTKEYFPVNICLHTDLVSNTESIKQQELCPVQLSPLSSENTSESFPSSKNFVEDFTNDFSVCILQKCSEIISYIEYFTKPHEISHTTGLQVR